MHDQRKERIWNPEGLVEDPAICNKDVMLSEINKTQKEKNCMISLVREIFKSWIHRSTEEKGGCHEWGGGRSGEVLAKGYNIAIM